MDLKSKYPLGDNSQGLCLNLLETSQEKAGTDEQDQRDTGLGYHEHRPQATESW